MTQTKTGCAILLAAGLFHTGCSTTSDKSRDEGNIPPPVAISAEPEAEIEDAPQIELVPVAEPEPVVEKPIEDLVEELPEPKVAPSGTITILGYIKYVELEGGFFGIMTEDGAKYFPEYLRSDFKQDGLSVRVVALPQEQILGIQMWGSPIKVLKIEAN